MKRILAVVLCAAFVLAFAGCNNNANTDPNASATPGADASPTGPVEPVIIKCEMVIKDYGVLKIDLYAHKAPQTVYNFVYLAKQGFYNGIIFHKIVDGYSIQAGKYEQGFVARVPEKGPYTIFGEFQENGFENSLSHGRGVLSMARMAKDTEDGTSKYDTASTEFFICLSTANSLSLNGSFAAFGVVTEGLEILDEISKTETYGETPNNPPLITLVSIYGPDLPEPDFMFPQS